MASSKDKDNSASKPKPWWAALSDMNSYLLYDLPFLGSSKSGVFQPRLAINLHKLLVFPVYSCFALYHHGAGAGSIAAAIAGLASPAALASAWAQTSTSARILAAFHSTYGLLWCVKDTCYGDRAWAYPCTAGSALNLFLSLGALYYPAGYFATAATATGGVGPATVLAATLSFAFGLFLHFGADIQKYTILHTCEKRGLITNGLFAFTRNPNYLGEMLIYSSYCLLSTHWMPWLNTITMWFVLFLPNMLAKDKSISRHPGWAQYASQSNMLFPNPLSLISSLALAVTSTGKKSK